MPNFGVSLCFRLITDGTKKFRIEMKKHRYSAQSFLLGILLVASATYCVGATSGISQIGRFQAVTHGQSLFMVDTATGIVQQTNLYTGRWSWSENFAKESFEAIHGESGESR